MTQNWSSFESISQRIERINLALRIDNIAFCVAVVPCTLGLQLHAQRLLYVTIIPNKASVVA